MSKSCSLILAKTHLEKRLSEVSTAIKKKNITKKKILIQNCLRFDFSSAEIELFFSKLDDNGDGKLDIQESGDVEELNDDVEEGPE